jgi:hypothetical protein
VVDYEGDRRSPRMVSGHALDVQESEQADTTAGKALRERQTGDVGVELQRVHEEDGEGRSMNDYYERKSNRQPVKTSTFNKIATALAVVGFLALTAMVPERNADTLTSGVNRSQVMEWVNRCDTCHGANLPMQYRELMTIAGGKQ